MIRIFPRRFVVRAVSTFARRLVIGRVPKLFDAAYYLRQNSDVRDSGLDPYLHYILRGASENRDPAEDFDTKFFRSQSGVTRLDPIRHYLRIGATAGLDPNPNFSTQSYLNRYPDVAALGVNPLLHYRTDGRKEGRTRESSTAKAAEIPALRSVLSRHLRSLPLKDGRPFAINLLRESNCDHPLERVPRFCVQLKLTHEEIALLVNALGAMCAGDHAVIGLDVVPERESPRVAIREDEAGGSNARPKFDTLLLAFEHCHVAAIGEEVMIRYAELRMWDLRPHKARVAEIFPAGIAMIYT